MSKNYGVYIHIPFCRSKCGYCAFVSLTDMSLRQAYVDVLLREIESCPESGSDVDTVYIGGGTPSCLYDGAILSVLKKVYSTFKVDRNAEITVECNPESATQTFADECKSSGVNRISIGLQSASDSILRSIGRVHDRARFISALGILGSRFDNISSDIILGLPEQTVSDIETAVKIISDNCTHASVYALTVENGTPLYRSGYTPDDDLIAEFYDRACDLLYAHGFERYEVSNFARSGKQSRHNNKYWACEPYIGFGVAAHGYDGNDIRYGHTDDVHEYLSAPLRKTVCLSDKDRYNEYVMLRLRTECGIDRNAFCGRFGYDFIDRNATILKKMEKDGLIICNGETVRISPKYMFVMNGIIEELMLD